MSAGHLAFGASLRWRLVQLAAAAIARWPACAQTLIPVLGMGGYLLAPRARWAVQGNLAHLRPHASRTLRRRLCRTIFASVARYYVELFSLPSTTPARLLARTDLTGYEHFQAALRQGRGVIVASVHQGPAEVLLQAFAARGVTYTAMVERLQPPQLDRLLRRVRERHGHHYVAADLAGTKALLRALRAGGVVALLIDRDVTGAGIEVQFCGAPYRAPAGVIELARATGAAIVPAYVHWTPSGRYRATMLPAFVPSARRHDPAGERADLERLLALFLPHLRRYAGQWLVLQPLWQPGARRNGVY